MNNYNQRILEYTEVTTQRKKYAVLFKVNQFETEGCLIMEHQPMLLFISVQFQKSFLKKWVPTVFTSFTSVFMSRCTARTVHCKPYDDKRRQKAIILWLFLL